MKDQAFNLYAISSLAVKALLLEVSITPKPGLVDRFNSGAHRDMDFYTFVDSSMALTDYFYHVTLAGYRFEGTSLQELFASIRGLGMEAESCMYTATKGVNTHKGLIFSLGVLFCAAGYLLRRQGTLDAASLSQTSAAMTRGITQYDFANINIHTARTNGERLYALYGCKGIRDEAEKGFPSALDVAFPALKRGLAIGLSLNDAGLYALLHIMSVLDDTNVLSRHDEKVLRWVKDSANQALLSCNNSFSQAFIATLEKMDTEFICKNVSPGGSADILAIALAVYLLEKEFLIPSSAQKPSLFYADMASR